MTIEEVLHSDKLFLTPADIAPIIHSDPQTIRTMAKDRPDLLGFPSFRTGKLTKIPRVPFLRFLGYEEAV